MKKSTTLIVALILIIFCSFGESLEAQTISKEKPGSFQKVFGITNMSQSPMPSSDYKITIGSTKKTQSTQGNQTTKQQQNQVYAEIGGEYGFSSLSKATFKASYTHTSTNVQKTMSSELTSNQLNMKQELTLHTGIIPPGKGYYVYQPVIFGSNAQINFRDLIISDEELDFTPGNSKLTVRLEGNKPVDNRTFALVSMYGNNQKVLSYYANNVGGIYAGDNWVLAKKPNDPSVEWTFERCDSYKDISVFWIIHKGTGKLLSWYKGAPGNRVYPGDTWVKKDPYSVEALSSLWQVIPAIQQGEGEQYYIQQFKDKKLLSWYDGQSPYAGDNEVLNNATVNKGVIWKLIPRE